jgi:hypothetical protein
VFRKAKKPVLLKVSDVTLDDVFSDVVRVHISHRRFANAGAVIRISCNGKSAYAVARGPKGVGSTGIAMDMAIRDRLDVKPGQDRNFVFEKAGVWGQLCWAWRATDAMPRIAARLGVLSVMLGLIGLGMGALSLFGGSEPVVVTVHLSL